MTSAIADPASTSAWSFGGSILTFVFPMILFIVVACALYIAYTKPELAPGHRNPAAQRPVSYTAVPGEPAKDSEQASGGPWPAAAGGQASPAAAGGQASSTAPSDEQARGGPSGTVPAGPASQNEPEGGE